MIQYLDLSDFEQADANSVTTFPIEADHDCVFIDLDSLSFNF